MMQTLDGRIALARGRPITDKGWQSIINPGGVFLYKKVRKLIDPDAVLEGSGNILSSFQHSSESLPPVEGDKTLLYSDFIVPEILQRKGFKGWYVVVDSRGLIRWVNEEHEGWHLLVLVARSTPAQYLSFLRQKGIPYLIVGERRVELSRALEVLYKKVGIKRIVSQGGGRLNGSLLRAGLVDEVDIIILPDIVGGRRTPASFDAPELANGEDVVHLE